MGEGAAVLALEAWERAVGRGAPILAEMVGFGASTDAYHLTAPLPSGRVAAAAISAALADGDVAADEIGYVNAHACSTPLNEAAEARALHLALGAHAGRRARVGDEGPVRPRARRIRRHRGRHHACWPSATGCCPAPATSSSWTPSWSSTSCAKRCPRGRARRSRPPSASGA